MMLNAAAAAFYYLRVVVVMYMRGRQRMRPPSAWGLHPRRPGGRGGATIAIGLLPAVTQAILEWTEAAALALAL